MAIFDGLVWALAENGTKKSLIFYAHLIIRKDIYDFHLAEFGGTLSNGHGFGRGGGIHNDAKCCPISLKFGLKL